MTETLIDNAQQTLLALSGIEIRDLETVLGTLANRSVDLADLYFEYSKSESWSLEDGIVKEGAYAIDQGVGVRAISGEKTGFAYSDELALPALKKASEAARAITRQGQSSNVKVATQTSVPSLYAPVDPLMSVPTESKLQLLKSLDSRIRDADPRVQEVMVSLTGSYSSIIVAGSDGTLGADQRPLVRLNVNVIVEQGGRRESASYGGG